MPRPRKQRIAGKRRSNNNKVPPSTKRKLHRVFVAAVFSTVSWALSTRHFAVLDTFAAVAKTPSGRRQTVQNESSYSNSKSNTIQQRNASFPSQCSASQIETIKRQLNCGPRRCMIRMHTACPINTWIEAFYKERTTSVTSRPQQYQQTALVVGCNKAMDAVETLRMLSNNNTFDKNVWRDALYKGKSFAAGACRQDIAPQWPILINENNKNDPSFSVVHCIEAMPNTARELLRTAQQLGWQDNLVVTHAAMSDKDGIARFPDGSNDTMGQEGTGIDACSSIGTTTANSNCVEVQQYKLDTFYESVVDSGGQQDKAIDMLLVDVEGFDWPVLMGGEKTLAQSRYLEFEVHSVGVWPQFSLKVAVESLKSQGFVCYWSGKNKLWRITDCWIEQYERKMWSNIACVNRNHAEVDDLANHMEHLFLQTIGEL